MAIDLCSVPLLSETFILENTPFSWRGGISVEAIWWKMYENSVKKKILKMWKKKRV
jgi:hypothetical protein